MKIEIEEQRVPFGDIQQGECFIYEDNVYMKTDLNNLSVRLINGKTMSFTFSLLVKKTEVTATVKH